MPTDGQTDMMYLTVDSRDFANALKNRRSKFFKFRLKHTVVIISNIYLITPSYDTVHWTV